MNEAETRAELIDPALKAAGWGVVEGSRIRREYPIAPGRIESHGKRGKELTADYVLESRMKSARCSRGSSGICMTAGGEQERRILAPVGFWRGPVKMALTRPRFGQKMAA